MGVIKPYESDPGVITLYIFAHETCKKFVNPEDEELNLEGSLGIIGIIKKKQELWRNFLNPSVIKECSISHMPIKARRRKRQLAKEQKRKIAMQDGSIYSPISSQSESGTGTYSHKEINTGE